MNSNEWRGRLFVLSTDLAGGGAEAQAVNLAIRLKARGWGVEMASMVEAGPSPVPLVEAGIRMHCLHMRPGRPDPRVVPPLIAMLRRDRPHVVHTHMVHANLLARTIRHALPPHVLICTLHNVNMSGIHHDHGRVFEIMHRWTDPLADITTAICQCAADECVRVKAVPRHKMRVIPNGIDMNVFRPHAGARERIRRDLGVAEKFVWLAAGRLEAQKDYGNMLQAFAALSPEEREETILLISGTGSLERKLISLAEELRMGGQVRLLGRRSDMPDVLNAADAFVMSSVFEGSPLALLEAAATGLPIVATAVGGNPEIVLQGRTGFLCEPCNPLALSEQLRRMMRLPVAERRSMGAAGQALIGANHRIETVVDRWEDLYREVLSRRAGGSAPDRLTA
ncbi:MAG: glycosyltransferase [Acidobacteriota bacterium]|nr:glycosyltransferase [Acidobacteriota bacterium]